MVNQKIEAIIKEMDALYEQEKLNKSKLAKLEEQKRKLIREENEEFGKLVMANIDVLIDVSRHNRTSCSDKNLCNCGDDYPCPRCHLIRAKNTDWWDTDYDLKISIERNTGE